MITTAIPDISDLTAVDVGLLLASDQSLDLVPGTDGDAGHLVRNDKPCKPRPQHRPQGYMRRRGTQPFPHEV